MHHDRALLTFGACAVGLSLLALATVACQTGAETPNAYYGRDGGPGQLGQPCVGGDQCTGDTLVCVQASDEEEATCRASCSVNDDDPCGVAFFCRRITGTEEGACVPAPAAGEPCTTHCDDGLACVANEDGDGGTCRIECEPESDDCPEGQSCNGVGLCE